jgi:hypothetical protein
VVLALSEVGKYLFSNNVATFLNYLTSGGGAKTGWDDFIASLLIVIANLILWVPIKREIYQTGLY